MTINHTPDDEIRFTVRVPLDRSSPLREFYCAEKARFPEARAGRIGHAFASAMEHLMYCDIIAGRALDLSKRHWSETLRRINCGPAERAGDRLYVDLQRRLGILVHLEIASYFQFAKTTLDRLARATRVYFGPAHQVRLDSHQAFVGNIERFAALKGLTTPPVRLLCVGRTLLDGVVRYRDKKIVHDDSQSSHAGTIVDPAKGASIVRMPSKGSPDERSQSEFLGDIQDKISEFLLALVAYLDENKTHAAGAT